MTSTTSLHKFTIFFSTEDFETTHDDLGFVGRMQCTNTTGSHTYYFDDIITFRDGIKYFPTLHAHNLRFINIVANNLKRTFDATAISTNGAYNVTLDGISVNGAYSAAQNLINSVMAPNCQFSNEFLITVANARDFALGSPMNAAYGQRISITPQQRVERRHGGLHMERHFQDERMGEPAERT
jgi:hypothetical protein